jgi:hypothetical protein
MTNAIVNSVGAAVTLATSEIVALMTEVEKNQINAACESAKAQNSIAQAGAQATINAANDAATGLYFQMAGSIAGAVGAGVSMGSAMSSYRSAAALEAHQSPEITSFKNTEKTFNEMGAPGQAGIGNGPRVEVTGDQLNTAKARIGTGQAHALTDDQLEALTPNQKSDLLEAIGKRRAVLDNQRNQNDAQLRRSDDYWTGLSTVSNLGGQAGGAAGNAYWTAEKGKQDAIAAIANSSSNQIPQIGAALLDGFNRKADQIAAAIQAKNQTLQALTVQG